MPASERKQFLESSSLAGFGAVYDYIGERLILIGGEWFKLNSFLRCLRLFVHVFEISLLGNIFQK